MKYPTRVKKKQQIELVEDKMMRVSGVIHKYDIGENAAELIKWLITRIMMIVLIVVMMIAGIAL